MLGEVKLKLQRHPFSPQALINLAFLLRLLRGGSIYVGWGGLQNPDPGED